MNVKAVVAPVCAFLLVVALGGCATQRVGGLTVSPGTAYTYQTNTGETIEATYYQLSDDSLSFVKVVMPDGEEYTLPQVVSASGSRYTDDRVLVWWSKGDEALVEKRNDGGEWDALFEEVKVVSKDK